MFLTRFHFRKALNSDVNDFAWCMLVCGHLEKSLDILTNEFNFDEREQILEKFVMAKTLWSCKKCLGNDYKEASSVTTQNVVELVLSGYIECRLCRHWFHRMCAQALNSDQQLSSSDANDMNYVCEHCQKLFVVQVQPDSLTETVTHHPNNIVHHIKQVRNTILFTMGISSSFSYSPTAEMD